MFDPRTLEVTVNPESAWFPSLQKDRSVSFDEVTSLVNEMEKEWEMLTVQDVVWNHAAKNAPWLQVSGR